MLTSLRKHPILLGFLLILMSGSPALAADCTAPDAQEIAFSNGLSFCVRGAELRQAGAVEGFDGTPSSIRWGIGDLFFGPRGGHKVRPDTPPDLAAAWPPGVTTINILPRKIRPRPEGLPIASDIPDMRVEHAGRPIQLLWPIGLDFRGHDAISVSCTAITYWWMTIENAESCIIYVDAGTYGIRLLTLTQAYDKSVGWPRVLMAYDRAAWQAALDTVDTFLRLTAASPPKDL
ncbi:hypothetical protein JDO7802_01390 [Jannaschia donghaensis]|uniref:Uncharacterized protein n=2 Tax=Jannaschia donghaensis TaxID=420998 RepID=A0A0M6YJC8_9RHOB|nr:hypothetical protein JDO7802_01390 [Jannaschia donghaensis]